MSPMSPNSAKDKHVMFKEGQNEEVPPVDEQYPEDELTKELKNMVQEKKKLTIPPEQANQLFDKLAQEFVKSKEPKLNKCARCYLCLQRNYVNQILFKNNKADLESIVKEQAQGKMM